MSGGHADSNPAHVGRRGILRAAGAASLGITVGSGAFGGSVEAATADEKSQDDLIPIEDWDDLDEVRTNLDGSYELINDLDEESSGYDEHVADPDNGWEPIGDFDSEENVAFTGTFDGQGNEIRDLVIDRPDEHGIGLFSETSGEAVISSVTLADATVTGGERTGSLIGSNSGVVGESSAGGKVTGREDVGGLVGRNDGEVESSSARSEVAIQVWEVTRIGVLVGRNSSSGEVVNSSASGDVTSNAADLTQVGGLVGCNEGTIESSSAAGNVTGRSDVGGLVGWNFSDGEIIESSASDAVSGEEAVGGLVGENRGWVTGSSATGDVLANDWKVGGLIGVNRGPVESSSASGTVTATGTAIGTNGDDSADDEESTSTKSQGTSEPETLARAGGLVGQNNGELMKSSASGDVTGYGSEVGGLVGVNYDSSNGTIVESSASGQVSGEREGTGGLVGQNNGEIAASFATGNVDGDSQVGGLVGQNNGDVVESFATGAVDGDQEVGGLLGRLGTPSFDSGDEAILRDSYWDTRTTGQTADVGAIETGEGTAVIRGDVVGLETDRMQGEAAVEQMSKLDFEETWLPARTLPGYPVLQHRPIVAYTGENRVVKTAGIRDAVMDWRDERLSTVQLRDVIDAWNSGEPVE